MLLSIIIPVYNVEKYIKKCVDSVLREAPADSEIILIDDGSTDCSPAICDTYRKNDSRILVIHKQNSGISAARNTGLDIARGQYIFFLDSDDYLEEGFFDKVSGLDADLVSGSYTAFYAHHPDISPSLQSKSYRSLSAFLSDFHLFFPVIFNVVWGKLYRRDLIEKEKLRFKEGIFMVEDLLFNIDYYRLCNTVMFENDAVVRYRQNEGTLSRKADRRLFNWYEDSYRKLLKLLTEQHQFGGDNKSTFYKSVFGNTVECLIYAVNAGDVTLDYVVSQVVKSRLAVKAANYNPSKKTKPISDAIRWKNSVMLKIAAKLYVKALHMKAAWRKLK